MASESESEKRETLADIVAEMRRGTKLPGYWRSCDLNMILKYHANRIEAAWKRERAEIEANAFVVGGIVEASRHTQGNAAAMREALEATMRFLDSLEYEEIEPYSPLDEDAPELREKIRDALSAPARNCDVVPVEAPEAADVFHSERPGHGYDYETHDWLLAPAAELKKEGKGDGAR